SRLLLARCGAEFKHIVYSGSGSEAIESALKVALQYWDARGLPAKKRFIARERSYHGNTLGALSVSGFLERRRPFEGSLVDVSFVSAANAYRPLRGLAGAELVTALADELDARLRALGPETVAAFIFEPVVGAAGGAAPGRFDAVGDVRGRGYLIGIEFVRDRATREPFPAERALSQSIGRSAFEDGLIIYPCAGNVGGVSGDTVIVAPPFNASEGELSELLEKLAGAIGRTLAAG